MKVQSDKVKVLLVSRSFGRNKSGGMERMSYELINGLSQHPLITCENVTFKGHRLLSPFFVFTSIPKVFLAARSADVIHLGDPMLSIQGWIIRKFLNKPVAVTVHGLDILYPNPFYQLYLKLFFSRLDLYLPISKFTASLLTKHKVKGTVIVINPGVTDEFINQTSNRSDLSRITGRDTANKIVLFTGGRLVKRKGHEWFIADVLSKLPDNYLYVISGDGPNNDSIHEIIDKYSQKDRVIMLGKVPFDDLKTLYNTVDIFVQPNITVKNDVEGFGLVLLEAALAGRSIIASNIEGISDAVTDGQNGRLLPAGDAASWRAAILEQTQSTGFRQSARDYTLTKFKWQTTVNQYANSLGNLRAKKSSV